MGRLNRFRAATRMGQQVDAGRLAGVRVVVTEIGWEGRMRRGALDTSGLADGGRWETLVEQVLASPPPYRADPGRPVYVIHAGDRAVLVGEQDLSGPLAGLVETILETGEPALAAEHAGPCRSYCNEPSGAAPSHPRAAACRRGPVARGAWAGRHEPPVQEKGEQMQIRAA
jgi:hypothetical protein